MMKERYSHELPKWLKLLGVWRINKESIDFKWGYFAPRLGLMFVINRGTYFNQRYALSFALGWGHFMVYLPFKTRLEEGCDMPRYGFAFHGNTFWFYKGGDYDGSQCQNQWIAWDLPFFSYTFDGHWILDVNNKWVQMTRIGVEGPVSWEFKTSPEAYKEVHNYLYVLKSGKLQERTATCTVEKRKWHRKWFPFLKKQSQGIDIEFNDEVGERTGTWKGGTIGCSFELLKDETIEQCLRRMEATRKF